MCVCAFVCVCVCVTLYVYACVCVWVRAKATHRTLELSTCFLAYTSAGNIHNYLSIVGAMVWGPQRRAHQPEHLPQRGRAHARTLENTSAPQPSGLVMYQCLYCNLARACMRVFVCMWFCMCVCMCLCVCGGGGGRPRQRTDSLTYQRVFYRTRVCSRHFQKVPPHQRVLNK